MVDEVLCTDDDDVGVVKKRMMTNYMNYNAIRAGVMQL